MGGEGDKEWSGRKGVTAPPPRISFKRAQHGGEWTVVASLKSWQRLGNEWSRGDGDSEFKHRLFIRFLCLR